MPSIEILVESPSRRAAVVEDDYPFAFRSSQPPESDRQPSLWQREFSRTEGMLYHLGEMRFKQQNNGWFYAYGLLNIDDKLFKFRFKSKIKHSVRKFLGELLQVSGTHTIHLTSDWQFCNRQPKRLKRIYTLQDFFERHDKKGIPLNAWITIAGD
jgi:hypothetical protein